jgi:putative membrane protein
LCTININKTISAHVAPEILLPMLGIAVSIFTSFRNSQAYSRWWEARSLWGALINHSRNWRDNLYSLLGDTEAARAITGPLLQRQVLLMWSLNNELRDRPQPYAVLALDQLSRSLGSGEVATTQALLVEQSLAVEALCREGRISEFGRMQLLRVLDELCNAIGGCEKVRNQPFPASYDAFIRVSVWVFGFLVYIRMDASHEPWGALVGYLVMAAFITAERLGAYIEAPFFGPVFALPMNRLCATITKGLLGASHPLAVPPEDERATLWT